MPKELTGIALPSRIRPDKRYRSGNACVTNRDRHWNVRLDAVLSAAMAKLRDIKVVIRSPEGYYLSGGPVDWEFTNNLADATVLHYLNDDVEGQLRRIQQDAGEVLEALHIHCDELSERCDRCCVSMPPVETFFDGREFLCRGCMPESEITFPA